MSDFIPFAKLSPEEQARAIQQRPTLHVEPVMVHKEGTPMSGPQSQSMGVYHLQLGASRTVLNADELRAFIALVETAAARVMKWEREGR